VTPVPSSQAHGPRVVFGASGSAPCAEDTEEGRTILGGHRGEAFSCRAECGSGSINRSSLILTLRANLPVRGTAARIQVSTTDAGMKRECGLTYKATTRYQPPSQVKRPTQQRSPPMQMRRPYRLRSRACGTISNAEIGIKFR